jgi:hypothetical protein
MHVYAYVFQLVYVIFIFKMAWSQELLQRHDVTVVGVLVHFSGL